jgi:hypothetical protein
MPGVILGDVGQVGRDQRVLACHRGRIIQQPIHHRLHGPTLTIQMTAPPFLIGMDCEVAPFV